MMAVVCGDFLQNYRRNHLHGYTIIGDRDRCHMRQLIWQEQLLGAQHSSAPRWVLAVGPEAKIEFCYVLSARKLQHNRQIFPLFPDDVIAAEHNWSICWNSTQGQCTSY
eukprot:TRINITY_DN14087_c0_g1_i1.p2 TRINITY_DN14087_c0_g1~~TRINITY_DN14087_c0_g1_i1.p2  ORF type:complete len:109 (+),score=1.03 TRINITY_DN14087_c0_g1_i1:106-432(+)